MLTKNQHYQTIFRCYPTDKMPSGLGDKLLLRLLAYKLGFQSTANFPKRAFQFGLEALELGLDRWLCELCLELDANIRHTAAGGRLFRNCPRV